MSMSDDELHYHPMPKREETQRRNIAAARLIAKEDAKKLWDFISNNFKDAAKLAMIEPEEPDEWDLEMIEEIKHDPDCHVFISSDELKRSLGMPVE